MSRIRRSSRKNDEDQQGEENSSTAIPSGAVAYSKWAGPFTWTGIIQGAIIALLTAMLAARL